MARGRRGASAAQQQQQQIDNNNDQEDVDDPVVHEVDVLLSHNLAKKLHILQFPLQKVKKAEVPTVRMKPENKMVEFEYKLNVESEHYCKTKGAELAEAVHQPVSHVDEDDEEDVQELASRTSEYKSGLMDKIVLKSRVPMCHCCYAACVYRGGELHMTPVGSLIQMRPCLDHVDRAEEKTKTALKSNNKSNGNEDEDGKKEAGEGIQPIQVKFQRVENEKMLAARKRSHAYMMKKEEEEPWKTFSYFDETSKEADMAMAHMYSSSATEIECNEADGDKVFEDLDAYVQVEEPKIDNAWRHLKFDMALKKANLEDLVDMKIEDRVKVILMRTRVTCFSLLIQRCMAETKEEIDAVAKALKEFAILVDGRFVLKSDIVYPSDSFSPATGAASEFMCRGRDYALYLFNEGKTVTREDLVFVTKLENDDLLLILEEIAVRDGRVWVLKGKRDKLFADMYPDLVHSQRDFWKQKLKKLAGPCRQRPNSERRASESRQIKIAVTASDHIQSAPIEGTTLDEQVDSFVCELLKTYGVCSLEFIRGMIALKQRTLDSNNLLASGVSDSMLEKALKKLCMEVRRSELPEKSANPSYVLETLGNETVDKFRPVILELLCSKPAVKRAEIISHCKKSLGEDIPNSCYNKIVKELAFSKGSQWSLKSGEGGGEVVKQERQ
eukprot:Nk52_evm38s32 gene=Nk52_evmTU38s32